MRWCLSVLLLIAIGVGIGYIVVAPPIPQPGSYREAVKLVLSQAGFSYRDIEVIDGCAPSYDRCRAYAGSVRVLTEATTLAGRIECRQRWTRCTLSIPKANVAVGLPNVVDPPPLSLEEAWTYLQDWFHQVTRPTSAGVRAVAALGAGRATCTNQPQSDTGLVV